MAKERIPADPGRTAKKPARKPGPRSTGIGAIPGIEGDSGGGKPKPKPKPHIFTPIKGSPKTGSPYGDNRGDHIHAGVDVPTPVRTPCVAPVDGKITIHGWGGGLKGMIHFTPDDDVGAFKRGQVIGWGHVSEYVAKAGQNVKGGEIIAYSGTYGSGPHVHFIYRKDLSKGEDGSADPTPIYNALAKGEAPTGEASGGGAADAESIAKATAFSTFLNLPGILDQQESLSLRGDRSLMNDQPLLPYIQQICQASLRNFQSMPNGNFFAFFPDYFGGMSKRTAYWDIDDIEIIDGQINLSDESLATHVYTPGDVAGNFDNQVDWQDKIRSAGVITIFDAFQADFLNGLPEVPTKGRSAKDEAKDQKQYEEALGNEPNLRQRDKANAFVAKYGARPYYHDNAAVRSPYYEAFLAYQTFMLLWARQFVTEFTVTFMPELYPGGIVGFPDHGIQCYIDEVEHTCSYTDGFVTRVLLSAPASYGKRGRKGASAGMIRAGNRDAKG